MQNTVTDFWQMVWEQNCFQIIMLTKLMENGIEKCFQYWGRHTNERKICGNFQIKTMKAISTKNMVHRYFELKNTAKGKIRAISHWQLLTWPDKGTINPQDLLQFLHEIKNEQKQIQTEKDLTKVIVHCSAGVGTTGTFIAIDISLRALYSGKGPTIKDIVTKIREQRAKTVEQLSQYFLIHKLLAQQK